MGVLAWLLIGNGLYLDWCAVTNRNPVATFLALVAGKEVPAKGSWQKVPEAMAEEDFRGAGQIAGEIAGGLEGRIGASGTNDKRQSVINYARAQLGEPYVFGAAGPTTWDCSGLTMMAYKQVGVSLPHNAAMQQQKGTKVNQPSPADLVFWGTLSGHVGIYIGNDQIIHAPQPGEVVKISGIWDKAHVNYRSYL